MAGLQYNFFPTDFYYPRPKSLPANDAARVAAVTIRTPKKDVISSSNDLEWPVSLGFRVHQAKNSTEGSMVAGVSMQQNQGTGTAYAEDQGKLLKYSPNPLSWFTLIPEELSDSS